jgi:hypothetical protein
MPKMIFVNLPVTDLKTSMAFYKSIAFENNVHFTDDTAACMVWSEAVDAHEQGGGRERRDSRHQSRAGSWFMYNRNLDPDGYIWKAMWMDPAAIPSGDQTGSEKAAGGF